MCISGLRKAELDAENITHTHVYTYTCVYIHIQQYDYWRALQVCARQSSTQRLRRWSKCCSTGKREKWFGKLNRTCLNACVSTSKTNSTQLQRTSNATAIRCNAPQHTATQPRRTGHATTAQCNAVQRSACHFFSNTKLVWHLSQHAKAHYSNPYSLVFRLNWTTIPPCSLRHTQSSCQPLCLHV